MPNNIIFFNRYFDKNRLKSLIFWSLRKSGEQKTIELVENLKDLGFHSATQAGLSLGIDDLEVPPHKFALISQTELEIHSLENEYHRGNLTLIERFQQIIDIWHKTSELLKQNVIQNFRTTNLLNPIYMMAFSGARGNISQVRQLVGMRGLMSDPQGQIIEFPIRSNFREGLTLTEYVISCFGARKGLVDTALRTANSGYLTRRLVDVSQHIIVRQLDCGTPRGIYLREMKDGKKTLLSLKNRLIGRVLAEKIPNIAPRNQDISTSLATKLIDLKNKVLVRSPLTCEAKKSICQLCYGWSLAHGNLVSLGEAVGILAAQSIGEPGTQLTMRTFHTGGVFSGDVMDEIRASFDGTVTFPESFQGTLIRTLHGKIAFLTKIEGEFHVTSLDKKSTLKYSIPTLTVLFIRQSEKVFNKQLLAEFSSMFIPKNQAIQSKYNLNSDCEGEIFFENVTLAIKEGKEGDIVRTAIKFGSLWVLSGKIYHSVFPSKIFSKMNDFIDKQSIVNQSTFISPYGGILKPSVLQNDKLRKNTKKNKVESQKNLMIHQEFFHISLKNIHYKKFSYFFMVEKLVNEKFFLSTSIHQSQKNLNTVYLKWFPALYRTANAGMIHNDCLYLNENFVEGLCFWVREDHFIVKKESKISTTLNFLYQTKGKTLKCLPLKNTYRFLNLKKNKQASSKNYFIENYGMMYFLPFKETAPEKSSENHFYNSLRNSKTLKNKRLNPLIQLKFSEKKKKIFKESKNNLYFLNEQFIEKKSNLSFHKSPVLSQKKHPRLETNSRRKQFQQKTIELNFIQPLQLSSTVLNQFNCFQVFSSQKVPKNFTFSKITIKPGWAYTFINKKKLFIFEKEFVRPGHTCLIDILFDQHYIFLSGASFFRKEFTTNFFKKSFYIKNKKFRWKSNLIKKELQDFMKNSRNLKRTTPKYKHREYFRNDNVNFFVSRNHKIFSKKWKKQYFLFFIQKSHQYCLLNTEKYKKILYKNTKNFHFQNTILSLFYYNKQKLANLLPLSYSIDFYLLKNNSYYYENKKTKKSIYLFELSLIFDIPKVFPLNYNKFILKFSKSFQFLIPREIKLLNYMIKTSKFQKTIEENKTKNFILQQKNILQKSELLVTSFSTPYQGEIMKIKMEKNQKQKTLILTSNDKVTLPLSKKLSSVRLGQLIRYGDQISTTKATPESGQIIQIENETLSLRKAKPILFSSKGLFHVYHRDLIEKNTPLITLFYERLKTGDIVQGIPKIEEIFEARQTKEGETISENAHTQLKLFFQSYKKQSTPQEAARKSIEKIQQILVDNVQQVYQSQGVNIADKHIEIIVRQMTTKVKIIEGGRTGLLRGEFIDLEWVEIINLGIEAQNEMFQRGVQIEKAIYEPIILGITKAALETESFISAASFQETTRILGQAAIERKTDFLRGLKENVILGHLIPAGTGFSLPFDPQIKIAGTSMKLSWLNYGDLTKTFSKKKT